MLERRHWSLDKIAEFVDGMTPPEESALLLEHARSCRTCNEQIEWVQQVTAVARRNELVEPPTWVLARAKRLFAQVAADESPNLFEKLIAQLTFDSSLLTPRFGVRGGPAPHRRLLYSAGDFDVDLQVQVGHTKTERQLQGQVMSRSSASGQHCEVELFRERERIVGRRTAPDGEFSFDRLRPGNYGLRVRVGRKEIEVNGVRL